MAAFFKGMSTIDKIRAPYTITDRELVKRDLLNVFYTRKGERVMRPNHGSIIWDLIMNPGDPGTEQEIIDDVERIIKKEPRVQLLNTKVLFLDHVVRVDITLQYVMLDSVETLYLEFKRNLDVE
jgi:phage baseplate assembly protein W